MIIFRKPKELSDFLGEKKKRNLSSGFVPTMGALHDGHLSLIKQSKKENDITICSIFVNPTQFNDNEDFLKYPVTIEHDILLLEKTGCDIVFIPSVEDIYPDGPETGEHYEIGFLDTILEGKFRPGHYQGVCQVVDQLLKIVLPDNLYLGQKDYQQCLVIKKLTELTGLNKMVNIVICPTLREESGLAMSSRNTRLNGEERKRAALISITLRTIKENLKPGDIGEIKVQAIKMLEENGFTVDYIELADAANLKTADHWDGKQKLVSLAAAFIGKVRLIDNMLIN